MADGAGRGLRLPFELIDDIIAITVSTSGPRTLSAMALVSQYCRIRANEKRFSRIYTANPQRFVSLVSLLLSQRQTPGILNIASFIVNFHYKRGPLGSVADPFMTGTMAVVFSMLFRRSSGYTPPSQDFILNLDPSEDGNTEGVYWDEFHPSITPAFLDMCYSSRLTELSLLNIQDIPSGILRYSTTLKNLRLDHVSAAPSTITFAIDSQIALTSLHVYRSVAFEAVTGILCGNRVTNPTYLSGIVELRTVLCTFDDIHNTNQFLRYATRLQVLSMSVRSSGAFDEDPVHGEEISIQYRHLTSLTKIFILGLFDAREDTDIVPTNIISGVTPRNLEEINLLLTDSIASEDVATTDMMQFIDFASMDELFSGPLLVSVNRIVIIAQICIEAHSRGYSHASFMDRCTNYIKGRLPRLCARLVPPFLIVRTDIILLSN